MPSSVLVTGIRIIEEQIFSVIAKLSSMFINEQEIPEGLDGVRWLAHCSEQIFIRPGVGTRTQTFSCRRTAHVHRFHCTFTDM